MRPRTPEGQPDRLSEGARFLLGGGHYVSPTEYTFESRCVRAGMVAYINGQKGQRSK